jgi:hypothetical protein
MEKFIKIAFKFFFFIAVFFYQNSGELLIMLTAMYFPIVYLFAFIDTKIQEATV